MWQDLIFTLGSIIFTIALFPSVISKDKPALSTSLTTGSVLMVYSFTQASLNLYFSAFSTAITGGIWLLLAYQKYSLVNKKKDSRNTMQA